MHGIITDNELLLEELHLKVSELKQDFECILNQRNSVALAPLNREVTAKRIEDVLRARRNRNKIFGELFADPAWDLLLESLAAHLRKRKNSVSGLCAICPVPDTTALRWIVKLEQKGLLIRESDPDDHRRTWILLSDTGVLALLRYFASNGGVTLLN